MLLLCCSQKSSFLLIGINENSFNEALDRSLVVSSITLTFQLNAILKMLFCYSCHLNFYHIITISYFYFFLLLL